MNRNPFIVSGYIPDEYFCDREQEAALLESLLTNQQNVVLSAPRRMGKTKLVDHVLARPSLAENHVCIFVDILQTATLREFIFSLGNAVFNSLASRSERLLKLFPMVLKSLSASFGYDPVQGTPTFDIKLGDITRPEYTVDEIFSFIDQADTRCLVVIDEFQQITKYPEDNVEAILRARIQKVRNANFVFAGSQRHIMDEMFNAKGRPFYGSARTIDLAPIAMDAYTAFARKHFEAAGKQVTEEAISYLYSLLGGVTLYDQQIMNDAYASTAEGDMCDQEMIRLAVEALIDQNDRRIRDSLYYLTEPQKAVLFAIFEDEPVRSISSAAFTKKHRLKSPSSTQTAMRRLLDDDFVTRREGFYAIADPLMDLWLRRQMKGALRG